MFKYILSVFLLSSCSLKAAECNLEKQEIIENLMTSIADKLQQFPITPGKKGFMSVHQYEQIKDLLNEREKLIHMYPQIVKFIDDLVLDQIKKADVRF